jgi:putative redox protein
MDEVRVSYLGGLQFSARTLSGHDVKMDGAAEFGGENKGPRPMELLLVGLAGCSGMDIASILKKKKMEVTAIDINVKGERASEYPKRYKDIEIEFQVKGKNVTEEAVKRAVELSMDKYCSVKASLNATIKWSYKAIKE